MIGRVINAAMNTARLHRDPVKYFRSQGVDIGEEVEIFGANLHTFGSEPYLVCIGNQVTVSHNVDFISQDGGLRVTRAKYPGAYLYGRIRVSDNCFTGARYIGTGAGSVIASGSIVTGEVPADVVAIGAPAKPVKSVEEYVNGKSTFRLTPPTLLRPRRETFSPVIFRTSRGSGHGAGQNGRSRPGDPPRLAGRLLRQRLIGTTHTGQGGS
jgi:hypothetical protein